MNSIFHNEKGVALVVTLAIVAILLAVALQLGKFTGDSVMSTLVAKSRLVKLYLPDNFSTNREPIMPDKPVPMIVGLVPILFLVILLVLP